MRAAWYDSSCAVLKREVRECPHGVELRLDAIGDVPTPCQSILMQRLRSLTRGDVDDLGEMQLDFVAERLQKTVSEI